METLTTGAKIQFTDSWNNVRQSGEITKIFTPDNCNFYSKNTYANGDNEDFLFKSDYDGFCYSAQDYRRYSLSLQN